MSTTEFAAFDTLDLTPIKMKLMHVESGEGWSATRANAVEAEYRRFLFLMKKYPDAGASPTVDVDTFWHYHILDTMKYARDCEQVFGYFLHHYPYVGIGEGSDEGEHVQAGERMREIYEAEFGAAGAKEAAWCAAPSKQLASAKEAGAWCAAPSKKLRGADQATAWCAAPSKPLAIGAAVVSAWCASPGKKLHAQFEATAWCAAPGKKLAAQAGATAWCAAPGKPQDSTASAWCAAPAKPVDQSANEARAWCAAPAKPLPLAA